jgi:predicted transcriptional regulator
MLSEREMYPLEIAKKLGIHEQKVYYHIRKLARAGAITSCQRRGKEGGHSKILQGCFASLRNRTSPEDTKH